MVLAVTVIAIGCASRSHIPFDPSATAATAADRQPAATDSHFAYEPGPVVVDTQIFRQSRRYQVRRITFPSHGDNGQPGNLVAVDYHRSRLPGEHPAVIILPIWGRQTYPSNAITHAIRSRSDGEVHVLNVLGEEFLIDWPQLGVETDEGAWVDLWVDGAQREFTTLIDIRRLVDWAEDQPEIDADRIGLIGFSHGALFAPALAAQEPRIEAVVLVMGGAHPHQVIARCEGARTETIQLWAEETFGWTRDDMERRLEPIYGPMDPARYPGRVDPERVLIFEAGKDECIPKTSRDALWESMGRPERYIIFAKHRRAFFTMTPLNLNWMRSKIWRFFEEHLLDEEQSDQQ
jgi:hypothetical protein